MDSNEFTESLNYSSNLWDAIAILINNFLLNHTFAIKKFVLKTYCASHYSHVYQWIHFLSKTDIEEFMLEEFGEELFLIPSHLFSFKNLKGLYLGSCACIENSANFRKVQISGGTLHLRDVSVSDEDLQCLIISCPALEKLTLLGIHYLNHLRIRAGKLKFLLVDYRYEDIVIEDGGNLVVVTVATTFLEVEERVALNWRSVIRMISALNSLLNLALSGGLIKLLAADYGLDKCPLRSNSLTLYLHCVNLIMWKFSGFAFPFFPHAQTSRICASQLNQPKVPSSIASTSKRIEAVSLSPS